ALLQPGDSITHDRLYVPDWGALRFDIRVDNAGNNGTFQVSVQDPTGILQPAQLTISLTPGLDNQHIDFAQSGFETFLLQVPDDFRGKEATLNFSVTGGTVLLDNVFFQSQHLLLDNPSDARNYASSVTASPDNYLLEKPQYTLSYNMENREPNWVSWELDNSWLASSQPPKRPDFEPDPTLPPAWPPSTEDQYTNSNYRRGHMTPNADRNRTEKDQAATFLMTNIIPQKQDNNSGPWQRLEEYEQGLARSGDELFITAGGLINSTFPAITPDPAIVTINGVPQPNPLITNHIAVPSFVWKEIMQFDHPGQGPLDVSANTPVFAVLMPNTNAPVGPFPITVTLPGGTQVQVTSAINRAANWNDPGNWYNWRTWQVSLGYLEHVTGLHFLN